MATELTGWQKVAREIGDYDPGEDRMVQQRPRDPIGHWLPAEAAAKEILRLRERLEELTSSLHEIAGKLEIGMDHFPTSPSSIFATLMHMHGLWMGRDLTAADQQQETRPPVNHDLIAERAPLPPADLVQATQDGEHPAIRAKGVEGMKAVRMPKGKETDR